jgi:hypothetical protein
MIPTDKETFVVHAGLWHILSLALLTFVALAALYLGNGLFIDGYQNVLLGLVAWPMALLLVGLAILSALAASTVAVRIKVGASTVRIRVPRWHGVPGLRWIRREIPYLQIKAVERRDEIIRSGSLTAIQTAHSIVAADGQRIVLGLTSPLTARNYPFEEASRRIAAKANLPVTNRGCVRLGGLLRNMRCGAPPWETPSVSDEGRTTAYRQTPLVWRFAFAVPLGLSAVWILNWLQS